MVYYSTLLLLLILCFINDKINLNKFFEVFIFTFISIIIIYRWQTGGDWSSYETNSTFLINQSKKIPSDIPTDNFLNILIYFTHSILEFNINIFIFPSVYFCIFFFLFIKEFNDSYFLLIISFPFFILLLGMGYIKQGLSLVSFLFFINYNKNNLRYIFLILAIGFHPAIIILIFIYFLSENEAIFKKTKINYFFIFLLALITLVFFYIFWDYINNYINSYLKNNFYISYGAIPRVLITLFCSFLYLFLYYKRKIKNNFKNINFYKFSSYFCIALFLLVFFYPTAVDRLMLFFVFMHIVGLHCLILSIKKNYFYKIKYFFIFFFQLIFSLWDLFAEFSYNWDYNFFLF